MKVNFSINNRSDVRDALIDPKYISIEFLIRFKVEQNGFPHEVFLIKILIILLWEE